MFNDYFSYLRSSTQVFLTAIYNFALAFVLFFATRFIFLWVNHDFFADLTIQQLATICIGGMRFDLSALIYLNSVYLLLMFLPVALKEKKSYQQMAKILFVVVNTVSMIANLADTVYFRFTNRRTTMAIFNEFGSEEQIGDIVMTEMMHSWYLVLLAVLMVVLLWKLYRSPKPMPASKPRHSYVTVQCVGLLLLVPLCILGIRGSWTTDLRPINIMSAMLYVNRPIDTALVLNTPFSLIRTISRKVMPAHRYFSDEECAKLYTPIHIPPDTLTTRKLNVVVLILESFSLEYITDGYMPFVDSLMHHSLRFEQSFANGRISIDAAPSVLTGMPRFGESIMNTSFGLNNFSSLASALKEKGYHTAFLHGAPNGSMRLSSFTQSIGFQEYIGMNEYNADPVFGKQPAHDGTWGIWDEEFLQFTDSRLSSFQQPFAATIFTLSSHHPFKVPEQYAKTFPKGTLKIHQCIGYADYALRRFFESASRQSWYENTLFVLTADHTNMQEHPENLTAAGVFRIPIFFFRPDHSLAAVHPGIIQQTDILPTVLDYLGYEKPSMAFGCNVLRTPTDQTYAVNYMNGYFQLFKGKYLLQFDGRRTVAIYDYVSDKMLEHNLRGTLPHVETDMEQMLKAIIQQYTVRMNENNMSP